MALIALPILVAVIFIFVYVSMGITSLVIIIMFLIMLGLMGFGVYRYAKERLRCLKSTDERVKLVSDVATGIRIVKFYCWEEPFRELVPFFLAFLHTQIDKSRKSELVFVRKIALILAGYFDSVTFVFPKLMPLVGFALYPIITETPLSAATAFSIISLYKIVESSIFYMPWILASCAQLEASYQRVTHFLSLEEAEEELVVQNPSPADPLQFCAVNGETKTTSMSDSEAVLIQDGTFAWGDAAACLRDISMRIPKGSLVAITGKTGCGKTSFLAALMGEMNRLSGVVATRGSVAYSAQQAWILNDTVRNNILFGKEFDRMKYDEVLNVCCMKNDLKTLQGGDQCEIGDRGINVSGGQKARISLARCCYSDSDIMVLDDPIAAVDAHVGHSLFHNCIKKYLNGKTRIMTTNASHVLSECDLIIVLENHTIGFMGTYKEYLESGHQAVEESTPFQDKESTRKDSVEQLAKEMEKNGTLTMEETKRTGRISPSVFMGYFKAFGYCIAAFVLLFFIFNVGLSAFSQFWVSAWTSDACFANSTDVEVGSVSPTSCDGRLQYYIVGYTIITALLILFAVARFYTIVKGRINASWLMHQQLNKAVLSSAVSFFDTTPTGRIVNRFNRDMYITDFDFPLYFFQLANQISSILSECIVIVVVTPLTIILLILVALLWGVIYILFTRANADFQRIEGLERSRVFSHFQTVLFGVSSIRTFHQSEAFVRKMEDALDRSNLAAMYSVWANYWLCIRVCIVTSFITLAVCVIGILGRDSFNTSLLGAALSSATSLASYATNVCDMLAQTELNAIAVERIQDYIANAKPETPMITDVRPPANWPSEGRIEMKDVKLRYRDGPLVLKGVNLTVEPGEKLGIVGRTGAGKSSMMIALFRITELSEGSVTIDGINVATLGLTDVRRALCIIPQDPVLFSASVRFNLDPFFEASDEEIWSVLEESGLKKTVLAMDGGLDAKVEEGGSNFSIGERQLICMARALLRKPKILIMDEATASMDNATDLFLQEMIRKQFANCSRLTVAHRLNTIMDSDRICVMDHGFVAECDTPQALLRNPHSIFRGMVEATQDPSLLKLIPA